MTEIGDTPRTDLFERARNGAPEEYEWAKNDYMEALNFARQLERELAEAWKAYGRERKMKLAAYQDFNAINAAPQGQAEPAEGHTRTQDGPAAAAPDLSPLWYEVVSTPWNKTTNTK